MNTDLVKRIKAMDDIEVDTHSGSYELVRQGVALLANVPPEKIDVSDLLMLFEFGNLMHGKDARDGKIRASNLPDDDKQNMLSLNARINIGNYSNHESKSNGNCGLFARGNRTLHINSDKKTAQEFIKTLITISTMNNSENILRTTEECLSMNMKGMQAGIASQILHLLKPTVFPILNDPGRNGYINKLGLNLVKANEIRHYIDNVRVINDYRDKEFPGKNFRTIDVAFWDTHNDNPSSAMAINELLTRFKDYVSRTKPTGGTANSYKTAIGDTLDYLGYKENMEAVDIPEMKNQIENLQNEFENNPQVIISKMKPFFSRAESYLTNGFVRASLPYFISFLEGSDTKEQKPVKQSNAVFLKWFEPLLTALKDLGGSATRKEAYDKIIENCDLSSEEVDFSQGKSGTSKILTDIAWARQYLVFAGYIDNSVRGKWTLTEKGYTAPMSLEVASDIFMKHANIRNSGTRYWIYSPGEQARYWDEFYSDGIFAINDAGGHLGDLTEYTSKTDIKEALQRINNDNKSYMNDSLAFWQFANEISISDVVYVKKGYSVVLGRGIVDSDYVFDEERSEYKHIRRVNWTHIGEWEHPGQAVQKALTDITPYTEYIEKLEALFGLEKNDDDDVSEIKYPEYTRENFLNEVYINAKRYDTMKGLLLRKKNLILQGAPGVGKTFAAERLAFSIMSEKDTSRVKVIQFHQSYSYEDFIMGWRPDGAGFILSEGPFYKFCKAANDDDERPYFFIIDEINRGNLSKIFGELLMLIEEDKRGKSIRLLYKDEQFSVPKNIHIIGMMNTADRSLAMIDYALRRRFAFYDLVPAFQSDGFIKYQESIDNPKLNSLISTVERLNAEIGKDASLGDGFRIGHSYFCANENNIDDDWLSDVVEYELVPLLNEYWFDEPSKAESWTKQLRGAVNG